MKNLLITGTTGFLGHAIAEHFTEAGYTVLGIGRRPVSQAVPWKHAVCGCDTPTFADIVRNFQPDAVIHAAGSASVPQSIKSPLSDFEAGPALVMKMLNILKSEAPDARVVFLSSAAIYGQPPHLPVSEDCPSRPLSPYGFHKWMGELICREHAILHGQPIVSARIFSAYGPGLRKQVIWDLCRKAKAAWQDGKLQGTGSESRDFIHARDIARAMECLLDHAPMRGECYNLASGTETSIKDLADLVVESMNTKERPVFDGSIPSGTPVNWRADITAIRSLGFEPRISIQDGIAETVAWFQSLPPPEIL